MKDSFHSPWSQLEKKGGGGERREGGREGEREKENKQLSWEDRS